MAGSYNHCTTDKGEWIGEDFVHLIENLGDAYEACHMMWHMIQHLSEGDPGTIKQAEELYYEGQRRLYAARLEQEKDGE